MHPIHRRGFDQNLPLTNGQQDDNGNDDHNPPLDLSLSLALPRYNPLLLQPPPLSPTPNPTIPTRPQLLSLTEYNVMQLTSSSSSSSSSSTLIPIAPMMWDMTSSSSSSSSTPIPIAPMMWDRELFFGYNPPFPPSPSPSPNPTAPPTRQWEESETIPFSLSLPEHNPPLPPSPPRSPSPTPNPTAPRRQGRQLLRPGKSETIPPPYPWATERRATIHNLKDLVRSEIGKITGMMKCKRCGGESKVEFDLVEKFGEVEEFIIANKWKMHQRAPRDWEVPPQRDCGRCGGESCAEPVTAGKKRMINWLFLLLGQMIGFCSLEHLKYFCKHTRNHRTGAKDRLVYIAYMNLCKQLHPEGPYDL